VPLRLGTQQAEARVVSVQRTLDAVTLESGNGTATEVKRHEVAECACACAVRSHSIRPDASRSSAGLS
jgi:sulfate adenylyltransferase subunit 1 (EFTu-like GTPase family)